MQIVSPGRKRFGALHGEMPHFRKQERPGHNGTMEGYGHRNKKQSIYSSKEKTMKEQQA